MVGKFYFVLVFDFDLSTKNQKQFSFAAMFLHYAVFACVTCHLDVFFVSEYIYF